VSREERSDLGFAGEPDEVLARKREVWVHAALLVDGKNDDFVG